MTRGRSREGEVRARSRSTSSGSGTGSGNDGNSSTTQPQTQPAPDSGSTGNTPTTTTSATTSSNNSGGSARPSPRSNTVTELYRSICNSRTRSRSRHGHRHHRRRHSWFRCKRRESNFPAAICNMLVLVLLCSAMAEPQWFYMRGGGCREREGMPVHYIGISKFFPVGHFLPSTGAQDDKVHTVYNYGSETLENCVSPGSVEIIRSIIALCFVAIVFSLVAFLLDLAGPSGSIYRILHRNAVFSILTVITCVTINGFSYWVASRLEHLQHATKLHKGSRVEVQFSVSFYLVSTAGAVAVVATACNLLRRYPPQTHHDDRQQLVSDSNDMDGGDGAMFGPENDDVLSSVAPPPPYTP